MNPIRSSQSTQLVEEFVCQNELHSRNHVNLRGIGYGF